MKKKSSGTVHPRVLKRQLKTEEKRERQRKANRTIKHIKPLIKAEVMEMLLKCYPKSLIIEQIKLNYSVSENSIRGIIEDSTKEFKKIGEKKIRDAQKNAIGELELTKALFARYMEREETVIIDDLNADGEPVKVKQSRMVLDKEASKLFTATQKQQHTILGLDKLTLDLTSTGAEEYTDDELLDMVKGGMVSQGTKAIEQKRETASQPAERDSENNDD